MYRFCIFECIIELDEYILADMKSKLKVTLKNNGEEKVRFYQCLLLNISLFVLRMITIQSNC